MAWGITVCASGASALFGGSLGIIWRPSSYGTLADYDVDLTQVQGRKIDNVLNEKFVTPPCSGVRLTPSFVRGFSLWGSIGPEGMWHVVFHVEL